MYADVDPDELGEDRFIGHHSLDKALAQLQTHIDTVCREARTDELNDLVRRFAYAIEHSDGHKSYVTTPVVGLSAIDARLAELAAQTPQLNPNKDTPNE